MRFLKEFNQIVGFLSIIIGMVVWTYTTFATIRYVDDKSANSMQYNKTQFDANQQMLLEIKDSLKTIEERTWQIAKQNKGD